MVRFSLRSVILGESLKSTSGANPAKARQKSEEELFVEGNLIKAQKALQQNQSAGEKFAGVILIIGS